MDLQHEVSDVTSKHSAAHGYLLHGTLPWFCVSCCAFVTMCSAPSSDMSVGTSCKSPIQRSFAECVH